MSILTMKNKFKKLATASLVGSSMLVSSNAYSFAGVADFNITDAPEMMMSMMQNLRDGLMAKMNGQSPEKVAEYNALVQAKAMQMQTLMNTTQNNMPNPLACLHLVSNSSVLSSGGAARGYVAKNMAEQAQKDTQKAEITDQISKKTEASKALNCTENDIKKGIYGCHKNSEVKKTAGMDRNPSILSGSNYVDGQRDAEGTLRNVVIKNSGAVITHSEMGSYKYEGVESAKNFLNAKYGIEPMEISNVAANNIESGKIYQATRSTYMNRINTAKEVELKYLAKYSEMEDADVTPDVRSLWNNADTKETLLAMNGGKEKYVQPKNPSEQEILNFVVNKAFTKASTAMSNLGEKGSESQLMAIQAKIALEQLDAMRDQNRILASMLAQQMNPITLKELAEAKSIADQGSLTSSGEK